MFTALRSSGRATLGECAIAWAAWVRDAVLNCAFFSLIGADQGTERRPPDFIGINYYMRNFVRSSEWGVGALAGRLCELRHHGDDGAVSALGWQVFPSGLTLHTREIFRAMACRCS